MAKKNYYAVRLADGQQKILTTWAEAQAFIATCPSNAKYKGFSTVDEANLFLSNTSKHDNTPGADSFSTIPAGTAVAFVDGSFNPATNNWGYGVVLFDPNKSASSVELNGKGTAHASARNVTGEVYAAMKAVQTAIRLGFKAVVIYHDYQGIASWADGEWTANQELTRSYAQYMTEARKKIGISFVKVAGHTGVELNERADVLSKLGCGVPV